MPDIATLDPNVVIEETGIANGVPWILYRRTDQGVVDRWVVRGTCNQCGLCVIGAANAADYAWDDEPGRPLAVRDLRYGTRLDEPVAPGFTEDMQQAAQATASATVDGCSLVIERP